MHPFEDIRILDLNHALEDLGFGYEPVQAIIPSVIYCL